jgi:alpha-tubulin suppressor-like RCC1 family protein
MKLDSEAGLSTTRSPRRTLALMSSALLAGLAIGVAPLAIASPAHAHAPYVAKAWGLNKSGQLGNGTATGPEQCGSKKDACSTTPVEVSNLRLVAALSSGGAVEKSEVALALLEGGTVMAWGRDSFGQLGNGTTEEFSNVPVGVCATGETAPCATQLSGVTSIAAGAEFSLALKGGAVMAWGNNGFGQLGNGTTTDSDVPLEVQGLNEEATAVAAGGYHALALLKSGKVMAWGRGAAGQLGNGATTTSDVPVEVQGLSEEATAVAAGAEYSLALLKSGKVMAWGENEDGQLGNGATTDSDVPAEVKGLSEEVTAISAAALHSVALLKTGKVMAWGHNGAGELGQGPGTGPETCGSGLGMTPCSTKPLEVSGLSGVSAISAGGANNLALLSNGHVMAWGRNDDGELGDGTSAGPEVCRNGICSAKPVEVHGLADVKGIASGGDSSYAFGPPPTVTAVKPRKGPANGGTTITITGTDLTGATEVKFGSTNASSFTVNSDTSISAVSPAEPAGRVDVTVTNTWGTSAISLADRYRVTPTVTGLSPNSGPAAGGTSVAVTGSGFATGTTATRFRFATAKAASVNCTSTTTCTVVSPAHGAGTVDVKAVVNHVTSPRNRPADQFTYN